MSTEEWVWEVNIPFDEGIDWNTLITNYEDGTEQRRKKWSRPKRKYVVPVRSRTPLVMTQIWDFYNARCGAFDTFYFVNPNENPVTDEILGSGDASRQVFNLTNYPLPSGSITLTCGPTNFIETTHYTLTRATGEITFITAPSGDSVKATYNFCRVVRFADDDLTRELFNYRLYNGEMRFREVR